ncbi:MAG: preprotein translocase subunit SecE [Malacoplasma sp.]|nr:preprotein translocase subunit SecE [Malacoplasma sp.]MDE5953050.1 preprotein translocase subunit SecE [Malacoplasma sp.]MDE6894428.1 preprotein translocase subunit SecE [Malacoplasma sp.]MDE7075043.1 preprotein translocase subunit SecE [Malacoplasma sp.]
MNDEKNKGLFGNGNSQIKEEKREKIVVDLKKEAKLDKAKKENKFKKFFFGVGKEFQRITWTPKKELASSFLVIIVVIVFFGVIFTLIGLALTIA